MIKILVQGKGGYEGHIVITSGQVSAETARYEWQCVCKTTRDYLKFYTHFAFFFSLSTLFDYLDPNPKTELPIFFLIF